MSATPVGYEAFTSLRRKSVTLLCILLASSMAMGITVYVDSFSVHEWNNLVEDGRPIAMEITSYQIQELGNIIDDVRNIDGVLRVQKILESWGELWNINHTGEVQWGAYGRLIVISDDYLADFPESYSLLQGRYPEGNDEIATNVNENYQMDAKIGDTINYTYWEEEHESVQWNLLEVVGLYEETTQTDDYWYGGRSIAIVEETILDPNDIETKLHLDIDRSPLNPFNAGGSLVYVMEIEEAIRQLDPTYPDFSDYSRYYVTNYLADKIESYMSWQAIARLAQITRSIAALLLVTLVMLLAIRHNVNERRYESNMLMSRGASQSDIERMILKEVVGLSFIGSLLGLAIGVVFSRFAMASVGFFQFNFILLFTEPLLISIESILISVFVGFLLPIGSFLAYNMIFSTKKKAETSGGKMAKITNVLVFIKWDFFLLILTSLLLVALTSLGPLLQADPILSLILSMTPLALFIALGSLTIKALRKGTRQLSKRMNRVVGTLASSVGIRRVGKEASSAGPAILVLVLAISLAWTNAIIGDSMPLTKTNQSKFAYGADATFHLDSSNSELWSNFTANVTNHELTEAVANLSIAYLYLAAQGSDSVSVVGMNPSAYSKVGYDHLGIGLNESTIQNLMLELETNPFGTIISKDVADSYSLSLGDTLRGYLTNDEGIEIVYVFSILGIVEGLSDSLYSGLRYGYDMPYYGYTTIGDRTIWVNENYLGDQINLVNETYNILCVRTKENANSTILVEDVLEAGGSSVLYSGRWISVSNEVDQYLGQTTYQMDRAVDTMSSIATVAIIFAAFTIYAFEGVMARKREIALLRAIGAQKSHIVKTQAAEMAILLVISFLLLAIYSPLHILNTLMTYRVSMYTFPVAFFASIPWLMLLEILLFYVGSILIFILVIASLSSRVKLSEALNAAWAESGPYGGEM
ncbi:MAG: FtsX-like permease family protein [Candidatus Thorarchaeota archaeon]